MTDGTGTTCGNCGKAVSTADVICPHCDVLLAAYQSPGGSTIGAATATTPVAESSAMRTPLAAEPSSIPTSPYVADAYAAPPPPAAPTPPTTIAASATAPVRPVPSPLRGDSGVSVTTPGSTREIAAELTEMARIDSSFAKSVEAQAKRAIVESDTVASVKSEPKPETRSRPQRSAAGATATRADRPARSVPAAPVTPKESENTADQRGENPDPNRKLNPPVPPRSGISMTTADTSESEPTSHPTPKALASQKNAVAVIAFLFTVGFVFRNPGAFLFLAVAVGLGVFFLSMAIKASKSTSRKSTKMPYDKKKRGR
ncbi:MAG: hypothetical protein WKF81_07495 [Thermomicrobiales bacterium]